MSSLTSGKPLYDNLDTAFVNLWSLLRNLTERGFIGRVHVDLEDYSADVFLTGSGTPLVHEIDRATGTETLEEAALHRLVLRARGAPGKISVFEGSEEAVPVQQADSSSAAQEPVAARLDELDSVASASSVDVSPNTQSPIEGNYVAEIASPAMSPEPNLSVQSDLELAAIVSLGGELIGAVERGITASGEDFGSLFDSVRLELADDYSFLDPMSNRFSYSNGAASLTHEVAPGVYVAGLSEALRRAVDKTAVGERARRVRERIALELLGVARKRKDTLDHSAFRLQLDRIAGTKVI
jgi:hypothetical protein